MANNPFIRGYRNLRIVRTLLITCEDDCPPVWRPLHPSQAHLPDDQVAQFPCLVSADFALITEGQDVPPELENQCQDDGIVRSVVYAIVRILILDADAPVLEGLLRLGDCMADSGSADRSWAETAKMGESAPTDRNE